MSSLLFAAVLILKKGTSSVSIYSFLSSVWAKKNAEYDLYLRGGLLWLLLVINMKSVFFFFFP